MFFFKNNAENETGTLVPDLLFFKKALYEVKASGLQLSFNISEVCMFFHFILGYKHETLSQVLLGCKKPNLGQTAKFYPQMYILQTRRQVSWGKNIFYQISRSYSSLEKSCSADKTLQKDHTKNIQKHYFVFQKLLRFTSY